MRYSDKGALMLMREVGVFSHHRLDVVSTYRNALFSDKAFYCGGQVFVWSGEAAVAGDADASKSN